MTANVRAGTHTCKNCYVNCFALRAESPEQFIYWSFFLYLYMHLVLKISTNTWQLQWSPGLCNYLMTAYPVTELLSVITQNQAIHRGKICYCWTLALHYGIHRVKQTFRENYHHFPIDILSSPERRSETVRPGNNWDIGSRMRRVK